MLNRDNDARSRHLSGTRGYSLFLRPKNEDGLFVDNSYATEARFEIFLDFGFLSASLCGHAWRASKNTDKHTTNKYSGVNNNADTKSQKSE